MPWARYDLHLQPASVQITCGVCMCVCVCVRAWLSGPLCLGLSLAILTFTFTVGLGLWCLLLFVGGLWQHPNFTELFHRLSGAAHNTRAHWAVAGLKKILQTRLRVHAADADMNLALQNLTQQLRFDLNAFLKFCTFDEVELFVPPPPPPPPHTHNLCFLAPLSCVVLTQWFPRSKVWRMTALKRVQALMTDKLESMPDIFAPVPSEHTPVGYVSPVVLVSRSTIPQFARFTLCLRALCRSFSIRVLPVV